MTIAQQLRKIAGTLFSEEEFTCSQIAQGRDSCLMREEVRPLNKVEKLIGWVMRPFSAYNPDNMCCSCRAYWHAENAAQAMERLDHLKAAESARPA